MNVLEQFGLTGAVLDSQLGKMDPAVVPGRVAHIDADFMAYIIACDTVAEMNGEKPMRDLTYKCGQVKEFAEFIQRKAGAASYVLHVTPAGSTKGGRHAQAVQQEYQATRAGREPPEHLAAVRNYIITDCVSIGHKDQEADDGLAQALYNDPTHAVMCSRDKDLRMVPGLHFDMDLAEFVEVPAGSYGSLWIDESKSAKKLVGYGPAFFFAQCLMGDTADNIKGLPALSNRAYYAAQPTQAYTKLIDALEILPAVDASEAMTAHRAKYTEKLEVMLNGTKLCGAMTTYAILKDVQNVRDAFMLVRSLFNELADRHQYPFVHWQTQQPVTANQALVGDMRLLWMRRNKNPDDVLAWLKENV